MGYLTAELLGCKLASSQRPPPKSDYLEGFLWGSSVCPQKSPLISCMGVTQMALALKEQGKIMEASHHFGYGLSLNSSVSCFVPQLFAVPRAPSLGTLWFDFFRETPPLGRGSEEEESLPSCMGRRKHLGVQLFHMQFCNQPPVLWHFLGT